MVVLHLGLRKGCPNEIGNPTLGKVKPLKKQYLHSSGFLISYFLFLISYFLFLRGFLSPSVSLTYEKGVFRKKSALFRVKTISLFSLKIECMFMPRKETPHTPL